MQGLLITFVSEHHGLLFNIIRIDGFGANILSVMNITAFPEIMKWRSDKCRQGNGFIIGKLNNFASYQI